MVRRHVQMERLSLLHRAKQLLLRRAGGRRRRPGLYVRSVPARYVPGRCHRCDIVHPVPGWPDHIWRPCREPRFPGRLRGKPVPLVGLAARRGRKEMLHVHGVHGDVPGLHARVREPRRKPAVPGEQRRDALPRVGHELPAELQARHLPVPRGRPRGELGQLGHGRLHERLPQLARRRAERLLRGGREVRLCEPGATRLVQRLVQRVPVRGRVVVRRRLPGGARVRLRVRRDVDGLRGEGRRGGAGLGDLLHGRDMHGVLGVRPRLHRLPCLLLRLHLLVLRRLLVLLRPRHQALTATHQPRRRWQPRQLARGGVAVI
mmetsp:Transcript_28420/g.90933  ORF Transcript_28420/g.90933 Transcript_28420/m.90933 type:complete len:318 (+) Transcript_28420:646-1599(+)